MHLKSCSVCRVEKPLGDFYGDRRSPDGRKSACKACHKAQGKASVQKHRDKVNARHREYRAKNADVLRPKWREYHRLHREQQYQHHLRWRAKNPERWLALANAAKRNYKARKRQASGEHSAEDIAALMQKQRCRCIYCGIHLSAGYHVDHRIALVNGGSNDPENLQLTCPTCNVRKRAKSPEAFAQEMGVAFA